MNQLNQIIQLIGARRTMIVAALLALNAFLAIAYFAVIGPMESQVQGELASAEGEISSLRSKIGSVKKDLEDYKKNLPRFEQLKEIGFLNEQDRFATARRIEELRANSRLQSFSYTIDDMKVVPNKDAATAKVDLVASRIQFERINLYSDSDLFAFMEKMQKDFPPQLRLDSFKIKREMALNDDTLKRITRREPVRLLSAEARFDWLSVINKQPDDAGAATGGGMPGGAAPGGPAPGGGMPAAAPGGMPGGDPAAAAPGMGGAPAMGGGQ